MQAKPRAIGICKKGMGCEGWLGAGGFQLLFRTRVGCCDVLLGPLNSNSPGFSEGEYIIFEIL